MARRPRYSDSRYSDSRSSRYPASEPSEPGLFKKLNYALIALLGGIFILGIGIGISLSSTTTFTPENVASRDFIDRVAPNPELCVQFGASAMVTDMRVFITLNPFNVYVTQPIMQPGCVLRRNNWTLLEQRKLVTSQQVNECKNRMNTFGFTNALENKPRIDCIYQNDSAGNLFLNQPGAGSAPTESENF
jgi:hypothetical protein